MSAILEAQGLRKLYRGGDGTPIEVLSGVDLAVARGEFVAIMGASPGITDANSVRICSSRLGIGK